MAGLGTGAGPPAVNVYHEKSMILPDVSRVLACLYEKKVEFKTIRASYKDILSLQASRSVPVPFYDGPVFLQDSRAICRYIAEKYEHQGYPYLLGKDVLERASIEQWLRHEEHAFDPPSRALFCHLAFPSHDDNGDDEEGISREKRKLEEVLEVYEQRLGESRFLAGNKFTLADLVHLPGTHHVITSGRLAYLYDSRKNVQRWWRDVSGRESWQAVLAYMRAVEQEDSREKEEELEQRQRQPPPPQQQQEEEWRGVHIDRRRQEGTKSKTVLVAPPGATVTSIIPPAPPPPRDHEATITSDHKPPSPVETDQAGLFPATEKSPPPPPPPPSRPADSAAQKPPAKTHQIRADDATPSHKDAASPSETSRGPPPRHKTDEPDPTKPLGVRSPVDEQPSPLPHPKPDTEKPQTPRAKPPEQRVAAGTSSVGRPEPPGETQRREPDSTHAPRGEAAGQSAAHPAGGPAAAAKRAAEDGQGRAASPPAQKAPAGVHQDAQRSAEAPPPAGQKAAPGAPPPQVKYEDAEDGGTEDETFSTKRLRRMFDPDAEVPQAPAAEEEAPVHLHPKKPSSELHDREKQATAIQASSREMDHRSPAAGAGAPRTPGTADGRGDIVSPPEGVPRRDRATPGPETTPPVVQQAPPAPPGTDSSKLAETEGAAGTRTPQQTPTDDAKPTSASAPVQGGGQVDEQSDKSPITGVVGRAPELNTTRKTPASDSRGTSAAPVQGTVTDAARGKPAPAGREEVQGVGLGHSGDNATTKRSVADKRAAEPASGSSQQTAERGQGVRSPTSPDIIPGDKSIVAATTTDPSAALPAPVKKVPPPSGGQSASAAVSPAGNLDANGKDEAAKTPPAEQGRKLPSTPGRPAPTPDTEVRTTSGPLSSPSPPLPSLSETRNEKIAFAETSQTSAVSPNDNEQLGGRAPNNTAAPSPVSSQKKSREDTDEMHKGAAAEQQLPRDQSRAQLTENKKQNDGAAPVTETGKPKEDLPGNASNKNAVQPQAATSTNTPSKLQVQSDQNKLQLPNDGRNHTREAANAPNLATSKESLPSPPEKKSMQQQQVQRATDRSAGTSLEDNANQGSSETTTLGSETEQQKKKGLPKTSEQNDGRTPGQVNSEEKSSSSAPASEK